MLKIGCALGALIITATAMAEIPARRESVLSLEDVPFKDQALAQCIKQYAQEQGYQTIAAVHEIPCFQRNIQNIEGLEYFTDALVIDLSLNQIRDWSPLLGLGQQLGYLDIHDNPIPCQQMTRLARALPRAFLVGFDARHCVEENAEVAPIGGSPAQPVQPTHRAPRAPGFGTVAVPSYEQVKDIVSSACGACHQNGKHKGGVSLDTESDLLRFRRDIVETIREGEMPPRESHWAETADGKLLLQFLKAESAGAPSHGHSKDDDDEKEDD